MEFSIAKKKTCIYKHLLLHTQYVSGFHGANRPIPPDHSHDIGLRERGCNVLAHLRRLLARILFNSQKFHSQRVVIVKHFQRSLKSFKVLFAQVCQAAQRRVKRSYKTNLQRDFARLTWCEKKGK